MRLISFTSTLFSAFTAVFAGAKFQLGTPVSMLQKLRLENVEKSRLFSFPTNSVEQIEVRVEDYHFQSGYLSMVGRAIESPESDFILKGTETDLYGWVVLKNRKLAFEYTTDASGALLVEQVPVTKIFPVCDVEAMNAGVAVDNAALQPTQGIPMDVPHIQPFPGNTTDITKLQSKPGAPKVLYMDMTRILNGTTPTVWTKEEVWTFWQGYSSGVSMFNVNVTTDPAVYAAAGLVNSGKVNLYAESGTSSCGVNAFGTSRGCTIYKKSSPLYNGGTLIHEGGHLLGLSHDGSSTAEYYAGFRTYEWNPIMGSHPTALSWANILWQYSKGEYQDANRTQDDFVVMGRHLALKADDKPGVTALKINGTAVSGADNWGQIERNTDSDEFSFRITGNGRATLTIDRIEYKGGAMLDVDAAILNSSGTVVVRSNPTTNRRATIDQALTAGDYTLVVKGGAEGTPLNGFSNYSSVGYYSIQGTVTGGSPTALAPGRAGLLRAQIAGGVLRLNLPEGTAEIALHSVSGARVFHSPREVSSIDLSRMPAGLYVLRARVNGAQVVQNILRP